MNTDQLARQLRALAKADGVDFSIESKRGKGSHRTFNYENNKSIVPWTRSDIPIGTLRVILKALGVERRIQK